MIVKINAWKSTGGTKWVGGFGWSEQRLEKVMLDTDLVEVQGHARHEEADDETAQQRTVPVQTPWC